MYFCVKIDIMRFPFSRQFERNSSSCQFRRLMKSCGAFIGAASGESGISESDEGLDRRVARYSVLEGEYYRLMIGPKLRRLCHLLQVTSQRALF